MGKIVEACRLLLVLAAISNPSGPFSHGRLRMLGSILYLAMALIGSTYIYWSAPQVIWKRFFAERHLVSLKPLLAAIAIGEYFSAVVMLLSGGLSDEFM